MTVATVDIVAWTCDQCGRKVETHQRELPPLWIHYDDGKSHHFCEPEHFARWLGDTIEIEVGLKTIGMGDAKLMLEEVVDLRSRSRDYILGCTSCGARRSEAHKIGCALHR